MSNIFTTENIQKYNTKNITSGVGEWTNRNGEPCIRLTPAPFYQNFTINGEKKSYILKDDFLPNTQYVFDIYADYDEVVYQGKNVNGGLVIYYTDGTKESKLNITGGSKGFIHTKLITPASKSIDYLDVAYYTNTPVYYRWDSYISPVSDPEFQNSGLLICESIIENSNSMSVGHGGIIHTENIIEY